MYDDLAVHRAFRAGLFESRLARLALACKLFVLEYDDGELVSRQVKIWYANVPINILQKLFQELNSYKTS